MRSMDRNNKKENMHSAPASTHTKPTMIGTDRVDVC